MKFNTRRDLMEDVYFRVLDYVIWGTNLSDKYWTNTYLLHTFFYIVFGNLRCNPRVQSPKLKPLVSRTEGSSPYIIWGSC